MECERRESSAPGGRGRRGEDGPRIIPLFVVYFTLSSLTYLANSGTPQLGGRGPDRTVSLARGRNPPFESFSI